MGSEYRLRYLEVQRHKGENELFVPDATNLLGTTDGDGSSRRTWVKASQYHYKLVAVDRHGNRGPEALLRPEDVKVGHDP